MYDFDHQLFLGLNFDGGPVVDRLMLTVSGTTMWLPLYALILWLVWCRDGWRNVILFTALMIAALVLSDMISGIFKHNGVLGGLLPDFEPRWRPMFTPALEGLEIAHARLGRTRPRRGRERPLRDRLGPCGGHCHAGRAVGLGHPPAVVHGTNGSLHPPDLLLTHLSGQTLPDRPRVGYGDRHRAGTGGLLDLPETVPPKKGAAIAAPFPFCRITRIRIPNPKGRIAA